MARLLGVFWILSSAGVTQRPVAAVGPDPFIKAVETARRAVVSLDCLSVSSTESKILERVGSAFLVSDGGDLLTAAHVITEMQKAGPSCPTAAIIVPAGDWRPEDPTEPVRWFAFNTSECRMDRALDLAMCGVNKDFSARKRDSEVKAAPVEFEWNIPPDGTQVAFTGFPLRSRDPMTFRANVAAFRMPWPDDSMPELVLDRPALPGFSGSPVYLANGKVVGVLVKDGKDEAAGVTIARPASAIRQMFKYRHQK